MAANRGRLIRVPIAILCEPIARHARVVPLTAS
jgi:hypothetical protein